MFRANSIALALALVSGSVAIAQEKSRTFIFTYAGKVTEVPANQSAKVWLPVPPITGEQSVVLQKTDIPAKFQLTQDKTYGNWLLFFEAKANDKGEIPFSFDTKVVRREVTANPRGNSTAKPAEKQELIARFLKADAKVPVGGKPLELLKDKSLPDDGVGAAKVMYDVVNSHMKYSKEGKGWGTGDSVWACDSKFGNCTDFHSLFISMARGNNLPSKFEMGFSIPVKRGEGPIAGYHCWAWFLPPGKGWVPVDISEANRNPDMKDYFFGNLTEDRVQFTTGRDIVLEPRQSRAPLNFLIYPYVEVDGQTWPAEKVQRSFGYRDVK